MMIVDAIDSAPNEHTVYFLLTAYMESLGHFERSAGVPAHVLRLPIQGPDDLKSRLEAVHEHTGDTVDAIVPASEVAGVMTSAIRRLTHLDAALCRNAALRAA
jgi:hypothetical protein